MVQMEANINLHVPIEVDGAQVAYLTIRRPKVRDQKAVQGLDVPDYDREIRLLANLCMVRPEVIESLDVADYAQLQEAYENFRNTALTKPASV
jgi:hypothetical protein